MDTGNILISLLAVLFSIYTYLRHDLKLKQQEEKINKLTIANLERVEIEQRSANIECNGTRDSINYQLVRINLTNTGLATAEKIKVHFDNIDCIAIIDPQHISDISLHTNQQSQIPIIVGDDELHILPITITWIDKHSSDNKKIYSLRI